LYDICSYAYKKTKKPAFIYQQEVEKFWSVSFLRGNETISKFKVKIWNSQVNKCFGRKSIYNSFSPSIIKGGLDEVNINSDEMEVPVLGKIAAGTPVEAIQNEVSRIPLPSNLEKNGDYFGLKVQGDSMIEAGIYEGDTVIIRRTDSADNGKIVVALIDEHEAMLKRIRKKGKVVALESANRNYETKIFGPDRVKVQGVLVSLYRNF